MFNNYDDIMTPKEVAEALKISIKSVYKLIKNKTIGSLHIGRKLLVPKAALKLYVLSANYKVIQ